MNIFVTLGILFTLFNPAQEIFPTVGKPVPRLELRLMNGSMLKWKTLQSRSTALFFFCPCEACQEVAKLWARQTPLPKGAKYALNKTPQRVIVFAGDAEAIQQFQSETGLTNQKARFVSDPEMKAAQRYDAVPCPRVFVWDDLGTARWISPENVDGKSAMTSQAMLKAVEIAFISQGKSSLIPHKK